MEPSEAAPADRIAAAGRLDAARPRDAAPDAGPAHADPPSTSTGDDVASATGVAAHALLAPGPGSDADRVYGEGEVDQVAAPIGGIRRPEYPARERLLGREGRVSLVVEVDATGAVRNVRVARSAGEAFDASAQRAVERTRFRAARLGDRPVASTVTVNVTFELD